MKLPSTCRQPLPRRTALAAAAVLLALGLSGCAALQIDVDVYKGPLVHDEDTQIQQLASIAMSGKAVMLVQRNKWLDTRSKTWRAKAVEMSQKDASRNVLIRFIRNDEWADLGVCAAAEPECRPARLINDMLSAYEDKAEPELAQELDRMRTEYQAYKRARVRYDAAILEAAKPASAAGKEQVTAQTAPAADTPATAFQESTEALRQTWGALVNLLMETKRLLALNEAQRAEENKPGARKTPLLPGGDDDSALRAVERKTAEILARLTEPTRLVCANPALPMTGELMRGLRLASQAIEQETRGNTEEAKRAERRAAGHLNVALRLATTQELYVLKGAMEVTTFSSGCVPSETISPAANANKGMISPRIASRQGESRKGVQREATGDDVVQEIDELLRDLEQTNATGFDRGRPPLGLDRLADEAANHRSNLRGLAGKRSQATGETGQLADSPQTKQLQDSVVDLASRMQFLAVNLKLVDETASTTNTYTAGQTDVLGTAWGAQPQASEAANDARAFKATLEVIANTLLVLAEDQRRQRFHRANQQAFARAEYDSAVLAFQLDPAKRFDQLLEHYRTRKSAALKTEGEKRTALEKVVKHANEDQTAARKMESQATDALRPWMGLVLSLNGKLPQGALITPPAEDAKVWTADAKRLRLVLAAAPAKLRRTDLQKLIDGWLDKEAALSGPSGLRQFRLASARLAVGQLVVASASPQARAEALARLDADLIERWNAATAVLAAAQKAAQDQQTKTTAAQVDLDKFKQAKQPSSHIQKALDAVLSTRATVLAQAAAAKGAHDVDTVAGLVKAQLQTLAADTGDGAATRTEALAQLDQWAAGTRPPIKLPDGSKVSALQTLDRIEAFLSYTRLDALNRGSTAGAEQATAALDALMARRERMSYLRPASTYLRSALATTGQQTDPALEWSNLLWATMKRLLEENDPSKKREREVRGELDKSFWQNVNKVRVSAGGSSNFAIAKDDVGNWYVKAMGGDLEPMVKAAKNLALFNLGGRVDSNLLRIDELRNRSERKPGEEAELKDLLDRKNGAAATAYGSTLQVFADNHASTVKGLLEEVDTRLKANALANELAKRWDATYAEDESRRAALPSLDTTGGELAPLHTQALAASGDGLAKAAGTTPSGQLLKVLGLLAQQRTLLREKVTGLADLVAAELKADQDQRAAVAAAAKVLAEAQASRVEPAKELAALQKQFDSATDPAKIDLRGPLAARQKDVNEIGERIATAHGKLVQAQADAARVAAGLATARERQARAQADVDAVWNRTIKDVAARQLRAVEEMETAARVVSQGVQGKAAKP